MSICISEIFQNKILSANNQKSKQTTKRGGKSTYLADIQTNINKLKKDKIKTHINIERHKHGTYSLHMHVKNEAGLNRQ